MDSKRDHHYRFCSTSTSMAISTSMTMLKWEDGREEDDREKEEEDIDDEGNAIRTHYSMEEQHLMHTCDRKV